MLHRSSATIHSLYFDYYYCHYYHRGFCTPDFYQSRIVVSFFFLYVGSLRYSVGRVSHQGIVIDVIETKPYFIFLSFFRSSVSHIYSTYIVCFSGAVRKRNRPTPAVDKQRTTDRWKENL